MRGRLKVLVCGMALLKAGSVCSESRPYDIGVATDVFVSEMATKHSRDPEGFVKGLKGVLENPSDSLDVDKYGYPVNPLTRVPGYVVGTRLALDLAVDEGALLRRMLESTELKRIFIQTANKYYLADRILTDYEISASNAPVTSNDRAEIIERVGYLWNTAELNLQKYFGASIIKPGYKDGTVRAKQALDRIDIRLKEARIRNAARLIWEKTRDPNSAYHHLTVKDIEEAIRIQALDPASEGRIQIQRAKERQTDRQSLNSKVLVREHKNSRPLDGRAYRLDRGDNQEPSASASPPAPQKEEDYEIKPFLPQQE